MPALPPILVDEAKRNRKTAKQLKTVEEKNVAMGHRILEESQNYLVHKGFQTDAIDKLCEKKQSGIARDISACIESRLADALVVSSSGKGRLQGFFMPKEVSAGERNGTTTGRKATPGHSALTDCYLYETPYRKVFSAWKLEKDRILNSAYPMSKGSIAVARSFY
jgi:hypothetical protein